MDSLIPVLDTLDKKEPTTTIPSPPSRRRPVVDVDRFADKMSWSTRLRRHPGALAAAILLTILVLASVFAPQLSLHTSDAYDFSKQLLPPSTSHPFGTDDLGRDQLARILLGGRVTLFVAAMAVLFAVVLGLLVGGVSASVGGVVDTLLMRMADVTLSIPIFFVLLLVSKIFVPGVLMLALMVGFTGWIEVARVVRSIVLSQKQSQFVEAARSMGVARHRVLLRHILPHTSAPVFVAATLLFAQAIMMESALSFLGYGVQPPAPSWGQMLHNAHVTIDSAPWLAIFPGLMIFVVVLCVYTLGDFVRGVSEPENTHPR